MKKSRIRILDIFMAIILVVGIGIFSYPFVEDSLNDFLAQQMIIHYQKQASSKNSEEIKKQQEKMTKKNQQLAEQNVSPGIGSFNQAVDAKALKDLPSNAFYMEHMLESSKSQKSMSAYLYSIRQRKYFCKKERHYWKEVLIRLAGKAPMPFFLGIVDSQKQNYLQICLS